MWTYRVCKSTITTKVKEKEWTTVSYGIHEAYCNKDGSIWAITQNAMKPYADIFEDDNTEDGCISELGKNLEMMQKALALPVIDLDTFEYAKQQ